MLPLDPDKPIRYENTGRSLTPELLISFFRLGFAPTEAKYRMIFLTMLTTGLRINEVCAMNIRDFIPKTNLTRVHIKLQKRVNENFIATRVIPEAGASFLRGWIREKWSWIASKDGYLFPSVNNRSSHILPRNVQSWLCKKRKILHELLPDAGFLEQSGWVQYKTPRFNKFTKTWESRTPKYKLTCHSFRHFYATHISKDPEQAQQILRHLNMKTTLQYRKEADLQAVEDQLVNELFPKEFVESIITDNDNAIGVWDDLRAKPL